jgi:hypothetical protein
MNWPPRIRAEFTRLGKHVDQTVIEELAQHAATTFETSRADDAGNARHQCLPHSRFELRASMPSRRFGAEPATRDFTH